MSKHDKTLAKLTTKPPSSNVKWSELKGLLESLGYTMINAKSGSGRKFYNREKDALIACHQPHPTPDVDKGCLASIAEHLRFHGFIKG